MVERTVWLNTLFDCYGALLTDKQRALFGLYHQADLSLGEIADQEGVSRQAIYDIIKRSETALIGFEERLGWAEGLARQAEALAESRAALAGLRRIAETLPYQQAGVLRAGLDRLADGLAAVDAALDE